MADQWMVRTHQNQLSGPYSKGEILKLIQEGNLGLQDEVCNGNHYWIYLHEREEMVAQLGIEPPVRRRRKGDAASGGDEEITETETASSFTDTDAIEAPGNSSVMMTRKAPEPAEIAATPQISVRGNVEKSHVWRGVAVVLAGLVIALVYMVIDILKR